MTALIHEADVTTTRDLILSMSGGVLSSGDYEALNYCTAFASNLWIGYINDYPVCAWGLCPPTFLSDAAYLWLYSTPEVEGHKFLFIRKSQIVIEEMLKLYPMIYGVTKIDNPRAIRWLQWLGATFGEPNLGFAPFQIVRKNG